MSGDKSWLDKFVNASLWAVSTSYSFYAINFLGQIFLARLLSPADFGIYAFALALREIMVIFFGFATNQTFIQSAGEQRDFNGSVLIVSFASFLFLIVGIIGAFVLWGFSEQKSALMLFLVCAGQAMTLFGAVYLAPLERKLAYKQEALVRGGASSSALYLAIISAFFGLGLWSLALREVLQGLLTVVFSMRYASLRYCRKVKAYGVKKQLIFGLRTAISRGLEITYYRFPDIVIQFFLGKIALGNFYQARYLSYMPIKLITPFSQSVLFSYLSKIRTDDEKFKWHLYWINFLISRLLLPVALLVFCYGKAIFIFIYGSKWQMAGEYFRYFSVFILFTALFVSVQAACYSRGKQLFVTMAYLLAIACFIIAMMFFSKEQYSALAYSIGITLGYVYLLFILYRQGIKLPLLRLYLPPFIVILIFLVGNIIFASAFEQFLVLVVSVLALYVYEWRDLLTLIKRVLKK